jgi:hypothetical protein
MESASWRRCKTAGRGSCCTNVLSFVSFPRVDNKRSSSFVSEIPVSQNFERRAEYTEKRSRSSSSSTTSARRGSSAFAWAKTPSDEGDDMFSFLFLKSMMRNEKIELLDVRACTRLFCHVLSLKRKPCAITGLPCDVSSQSPPKLVLKRGFVDHEGEL